MPAIDLLGRLEPASTAVLVIDMQNDFCAPGGYYPGLGSQFDSDVAAAPIAELLEAARAWGATVAFTRMVHHPGLPDLPERHRLGPRSFVASERRLLAGTWGAEIVDSLAPRPGEFVIDKPDYSSFYETPLESILRRRGISTLVLTGTVAYACVLHTAFDAFVRDFDVVLVPEAVVSWFDDLHAATLRIVELLIGHCVPLADVLGVLRAAGTAAPVSAEDGQR